jgi:hypothetical protein
MSRKQPLSLELLAISFERLALSDAKIIFTKLLIVQRLLSLQHHGSKPKAHGSKPTPHSLKLKAYCSLLIALFIASCGVQKHLPKGDTLFNGTKITVKTDNAIQASGIGCAKSLANHQFWAATSI